MQKIGTWQENAKYITETLKNINATQIQLQREMNKIDIKVNNVAIKTAQLYGAAAVIGGITGIFASLAFNLIKI